MDIENEHIDDSKLRDLNTQGGFTVPPGYFNRLSAHILLQTTGEIEHTGGVPEGYFEQSKQSILQKTIYQKAQPQLWYKRNVWRYAAAAVLLLTSSISLWLFNTPQTTSATAINLSDEEILYYLEHNDIKDIPTTVISYASISQNMPQLTDEETYIIKQTDEQLLLEEL